MASPDDAEPEPETKKQKTDTTTTTMVTITDGVEFDTVAREWRCKWSGEDDKKSLQELQKVLNDSKAEIKKITDGSAKVQRIVCGGCFDFKVVISLPESKFGDWEGKSFAPEESFLEEIRNIEGVTLVETQTYTLMAVDL